MASAVMWVCSTCPTGYLGGMLRARLWWLIDLVVVGTLACTAVFQLWASPPAALVGGSAVHTVLAVACTLPLLLRRRYAVAVFIVVVVAAWVQLDLGGGLGQPFFVVLIALYAVGAYASSPLTFIAPATVIIQAFAVDVPRLRDGAAWDEVVPAWFILLGMWGFGRWMRRRTRTAQELQQRAEAAEQHEGEHAATAVRAERARIARELHDLVAHSMGVIAIQSQGAQRVIDISSEEAREALVTIETAARNGLGEMRRLLDLLTDETDASTTPQPTLDGIEDLVSQLHATGMDVDLRIEGTVQLLPAGLELTGYRVVQEALTNALKHAGRGPVDVRLRYESDWLDIEITDEGKGGGATAPDQQGSGSRGLLGMRERVGLYGGVLATGPRPGGGFAVHARLPTHESPT